MPQFSVYRHTNTQYPLLLDIQSDLIADLATRLVAPLCLTSAMPGKIIKTLMPVFEIDGQHYVMITPQLAGVNKKLLGVTVADLSAYRTEIIAALDIAITGF
jgi:toxin CcdB